MNTLKNKIILVTGAGSGIGRAVAIEAAKAGATVILMSKTLKKLEAVYDEIMGYNTQGYACPEPAIHPINLLTLTPQNAQEIAQGIQKMFGRLDGIVHCAGMVGQLTPIEHYPAKLWQEVLQLNLSVPFLLTQACLPLLKLAPSGVILFSGANEGIEAKAYFGAYTCSKFGLNALQHVLKQELENVPTLRIATINPKKVHTGLRAKIYPSEDPTTLAKPEQIALNYIDLLKDTA